MDVEIGYFDLILWTNLLLLLIFCKAVSQSSFSSNLFIHLNFFLGIPKGKGYLFYGLLRPISPFFCFPSPFRQKTGLEKLIGPSGGKIRTLATWCIRPQCPALIHLNLKIFKFYFGVSILVGANLVIFCALPFL